ncbi:MAG: hypothetical protein NT166_12605 [Candidatus Aminicenantes bacterium]|nr:hypothetical protein [Candidatus Aminicenantes bacterium]
MVTKIQKWGNSQGLRFSSQVMKNAHISIGDEIDLAESEIWINGRTE